MVKCIWYEEATLCDRVDMNAGEAAYTEYHSYNMSAQLKSIMSVSYIFNIKCSGNYNKTITNIKIYRNE